MNYDRKNIKITFESVFNNSVLGFSNDYPFVEFFENGEKKIMSKADYIDKLDAIAFALEKKLENVEKGRWVALRHATHVYWPAVFFALEKIGYKVMTMDENISGKAMQHCIEMGNLAAVVSHNCLNIENLIDISFDEVTASKCGVPENVCWESQMCVCTSGTSSMSKSVVYEAEVMLQIHKNIRNFIFSSPEVIRSLEKLPIYESRVLVTLPMRHVFGFQVPMIFWSQGCTMVFPANNGVFELVNSIKRERIWFTYGVPALWKAIFRVYKSKCKKVNPETFKEFFGEQFTHGMIGGARIDADFKNMVNSTGFCLSNAYGSTETGGCISLGYFNTEPKSDIPGEYSGKTFNGHTPKIILEDGTISDEGTGELAVLGAKSIYNGSLENGKFISRVEKSGELYRTGDVFTLKDGVYYYQGRCSNMIVNDSGENIYPEELEEDFSILETLTDQFGFIGIDDEPVLLIHSTELENFENSDLFEKIKKRNTELPHYKRLAKILVFKDILPKTLKGEISKKDIPDKIKECSGCNELMKEIILKGKRVN